MAITASQVMELREKTGLGMMTCKKALTESQGDMQKAIENLRKQGQATMEKRADKAAKEGRIGIVSDDSCAIVFEVNAETDFVARNEDFVRFAGDLGALLLAQKPADMEAALKLTCDAFGGRTVESKVTELAGKIGERITFRRFHIEPCDPKNERIFTYLHGTRIGVLAKLTSGDASAFDSESIRALGKDIAMQVAASSPISVSRDTIDADVLAKEREIYLTQAQTSGKPEKIWEKIVEGKLSKFYKEFVLLEQQYIRDTEISVSDRIKQVEKECGSAAAVVSFVRYELGTVQ